MAVDNQTVKQVAFLSCLKIEDDKLEATKQEFNKILGLMEELDEVDTDNIEPLFSVNDANLTMRQDIVCDGNQVCDVLHNAPQKEYDYFVVPKFVE